MRWMQRSPLGRATTEGHGQLALNVVNRCGRGTYLVPIVPIRRGTILSTYHERAAPASNLHLIVGFPPSSVVPPARYGEPGRRLPSRAPGARRGRDVPQARAPRCQKAPARSRQASLPQGPQKCFVASIMVTIEDHRSGRAGTPEQGDAEASWDPSPRALLRSARPYAPCCLTTSRTSGKSMPRSLSLAAVGTPLSIPEYRELAARP